MQPVIYLPTYIDERARDHSQTPASLFIPSLSARSSQRGELGPM